MLARLLRGSYGSARGRLGSPLAWVVLVVGALRLVGLGWGLPASDGWDNDGIAPRDFLAGLVETYTPGSYFTYPPAHLLLLGIVTAPVTLVALLRAPSLAPADVVGEIIKVPYMTTIAYAARAVSWAMSLGIVVLVARIAEEIRAHELGVDADADPAWLAQSPRAARVRTAGWLAAAVAGVNATVTYYGKTTNLDVPYLFWSLIALLALMRAVARRQPRWLRTFAVTAVLAVGTKDQAYALFLLSAPVILTAWLTLDGWARGEARHVLRELGVSIAIGVAALLVVDAIVLNPTGFRARVAFLAGPASQDFAHYTNDWAGRRGVLADMALHYTRYYPFALLPAFLAGLAGAVVSWRRAPAARAAAQAIVALAPLAAGASFIVAFNFVARRTEHRFMLPQMTLLAVYGGLGLEPAVAHTRRAIRLAGQAYAAVAFSVALIACASVDAALVLDPRYDAERWLREHARPGDAIEVHGLNVYLPRFPDGVRVTRVGPEPTARRNPLPGVTEVVAPFGDAEKRAPRFIVVSEGWVWRYLLDPDGAQIPGRMLPPTQIASGREPDGSTFFQGLVRGQRGFHEVHKAGWTSTFWPRVDIHASTSREIWIFERN
jgi:hypothetical protein